jgi:hypothetical protein
VWSAPVTVAAGGGAGNLLPHVVAGGPGQIDMAYFAGTEIPGATPPTKANWYLVAAQTLDALDASPAIAYQTINYPGSPPAPLATYSGWTASQMMGACNPAGPTAGVLNGLNCSRSTDVWGLALDTNGAFQLVWPVAPADSFGCFQCDDTYVTTQTDGPLISPSSGPNVPEAPLGAAILAIGGALAIGAGTWYRRRRSDIS